MFKPLNKQMRSFFVSGATAAAVVITFGLYWLGFIGRDFSWPNVIFWFLSVAFSVTGFRLYVQQAESPEELQKFLFRRPGK